MTANIIDLHRELFCQMAALGDSVVNVQRDSFTLTNGIVALAQKARLSRDYETSDSIRELLLSVGIEIVQGTAGYDYEDIPKALKGRQVNDTWRRKT